MCQASPWQTMLKSLDHLTSGPAGIPNVVSCTGRSSCQLERDRDGAQAGSAISPPCCPLGRGCLCVDSLGVPGFSCCHLMTRPLSSVQLAPCLVGPVIWILEVTVGGTQGQVSFCD